MPVGSVKPVALIERAIRNSSKRRDIVLDPFGGSGSTLIAAEKTGRQARLVELDPRYVNVIVKRGQDWTGGAATLEGDGRTFDELLAARMLLNGPSNLVDNSARHERRAVETDLLRD
jgi:adenine specific DNA methylase Mod